MENKEKDKLNNSFDKYLSNYLVNNKIRGVFISSRDQQCYVIGEKNIVTEIKADPNMSVHDLVSRITELSDHPEAEDVVVDVWRGKNCFPMIPVDPNSKKFTYEVARTYLRKCLNVLGYDRNSFKKYGAENYEPEGWPVEVSWINFKGPSHAKIGEVRLICKALFKKHMEGIDFDTFYKGYQPPPPSEEDNDLNDDPDNEANQTAHVAGSSGVVLPLTSTPIIPSTSGTPAIHFVRNAQEAQESESANTNENDAFSHDVIEAYERMDSEDEEYREYLANESSFNFSSSILNDDEAESENRAASPVVTRSEASPSVSVRSSPGVSRSSVSGPGCVVTSGPSVTSSAGPGKSGPRPSASPAVTRSEASVSVRSSPGVSRRSLSPGHEAAATAPLSRVSSKPPGPSTPKYEGTPGIRFGKKTTQNDRKQSGYVSESDCETTIDEDVEKELRENEKIDTEDEIDLVSISDNEEETQPASKRAREEMLSAGDKRRDTIMQWSWD